jgi:predicted phosphoribosyltransferase
MDTLNKKEKEDDIIVLGIPRGGVITADVVARKLSAKYFDIVLSRRNIFNTHVYTPYYLTLVL